MNFSVVSSGVYTIDNFSPEEECEYWINISEKTGYEAAQVNVFGRR